MTDIVEELARAMCATFHNNVEEMWDEYIDDAKAALNVIKQRLDIEHTIQDIMEQELFVTFSGEIAYIDAAKQIQQLINERLGYV